MLVTLYISSICNQGFYLQRQMIEKASFLPVGPVFVSDGLRSCSPFYLFILFWILAEGLLKTKNTREISYDPVLGFRDKLLVLVVQKMGEKWLAKQMHWHLLMFVQFSDLYLWKRNWRRTWPLFPCSELKAKRERHMPRLSECSDTL